MNTMYDHESQKSSFIDPLYLKGNFFNKSTGSLDAEFKVEQIRQILELHKDIIPSKNLRIADVGCGSGKTTYLLKPMLEKVTRMPSTVDGYDIHPYMSQISDIEGVRFVSGDFCHIADGVYDLVVLLDVFEHVSDPVSFIRQLSLMTNLIVFHIPLDDSIFSWIRGLQRQNLVYPGHLIVLDAASAINLLTMAGLRVIDFEFSPSFLSPSGKMTHLQKLMVPFRALMFRINPYLAQKIFAGISLTVLALTAKGFSILDQT